MNTNTLNGWSPAFSRGAVVRIKGGTQLPHREGKLLIIRCSFPYCRLKDDAKEQLQYLRFNDDTPVYMAADVRGRSYFVPEFYFGADAVEGQDAPITECLEPASPTEEAIMIVREELRGLTQSLGLGNGLTPEEGYPVRQKSLKKGPGDMELSRPPVRGVRWTNNPSPIGLKPRSPVTQPVDFPRDRPQERPLQRAESRW